MKHVLFTLYGCDEKLLDDQEYITQMLYETTIHMGATFLNTHTHKFEPQGVTAVTLLAESHISIHTWPEKYMAVCDVFTCGESDPKKGALYMGSKLKSTSYLTKTINREMY